MNLFKLTPLCALLVCVACDPGSESLGDEPSETASDSGAFPTSAEAELMMDRQGTAIQFIETRDDGTTIVAGPSGYGGVQGDLTIYENNYVALLSTDGTPLWEDEQPKSINEFGELEEGGINAIGSGPDGSVFVAFIDYADFEESDNRIVKYDASGTLLWEAVLEGRPSAVVGTSEGGAFVAGLIGSEDDPNTVLGYAARIDSAGAVVGTRSWESDAGRVTSLERAAISGDNVVVLGGRWGMSPTSSESEAWLISLDDDLNPEWELRLPGSGATDRITHMRFDDDGTLFTVANHGDVELLSVSATGEVLSTEVIEPDLVVWSPYSPTGFLGGERNNCLEQVGSESCGQASFSGFDANTLLWEVGFDGCNAITGHAVDATASLVSVGCNFINAAGDLDVRGELHRITAE